MTPDIQVHEHAEAVSEALFRVRRSARLSKHALTSRYLRAPYFILFFRFNLFFLFICKGKRNFTRAPFTFQSSCEALNVEKHLKRFSDDLCPLCDRKIQETSTWPVFDPRVSKLYLTMEPWNFFSSFKGAR